MMIADPFHFPCGPAQGVGEEGGEKKGGNLGHCFRRCMRGEGGKGEEKKKGGGEKKEKGDNAEISKKGVQFLASFVRGKQATRGKLEEKREGGEK